MGANWSFVGGQLFTDLPPPPAASVWWGGGGSSALMFVLDEMAFYTSKDSANTTHGKLLPARSRCAPRCKEATMAGPQDSSLWEPRLQIPRAGSLHVNTVFGGVPESFTKETAVSCFPCVNREEQARSFQKEVRRNLGDLGERGRHHVLWWWRTE